MQTAFLRGGLGVVAVAFLPTKSFGDSAALRRARYAKAMQKSWGRTRKEARERFRYMTGRDSLDTIELCDGFAAF